MVSCDYKQLFHLFLLSFLISICYSNTLQSSWHFDDIPNIVTNKNIQISDFTWDELKKSIYSPLSKKIHRPVANLTFAVNYLISGLDTTSYHIFNIFVHIGNSWLAYFLFIYTLKLYSRRNSQCFPSSSLYDIALLGAVLWAVHPIQTQAVTYIVQRMASLATLFYLASFYCYLRFREHVTPGRKGIFLFFASCFFLLGLGAKQNTVLLPLVVIGYEIIFFRSSLVPEKKKVRYALIFLVCALALIFFWHFKDALYSVVDQYDMRKFTLWERLITQPLVISRYLFLIFCPLADFLILESDMVASRGVVDPPQTLLAILFIFGLIGFGVYYFKKYPFLCFAIYYYFVNHLVESTILPLELYFEHRNYLPSIFIFLAISYYFFSFLSYYSVNKKIFIRNLFVIFIFVIIVSEGNATFLRNDLYSDEITLHEDTIEKSPFNPRPYIAIAVHYIDHNDIEKGLEYLRKAERLYKKFPDRFQENWVARIYYNAGIAFRRKSENNKAIDFMLKSIRLDPTEWSAHVNLGVLFLAEEDYGHAEDYFFNALFLHPHPPADLYNLFGRALYANKKYDEAIEAFRKGLKENDLNALHYNLIAAYIKKGDIGQAKSHIIKMSHDKVGTDNVYFLYRALLFPGGERVKFIDKIAVSFAANNINYCEWMSVVINDNSRDIIFPDISILLDQLNDAYQSKIAEVSDTLSGKMHEAMDCTKNKL